MEERSIEQFKKLVADFRLLTTKVQKDNQIKSKNLKETNQVLEACKKVYQKLYLEHEFLSQLMTNGVRVLMKVVMKTKKLSKGKKILKL